MSKKIKFTEEQLKNDPSLGVAPYHIGEALWSDHHNQILRFYGYKGEKVRLATVMGLSPLPELVKQEQVRRVTVHKR